MVQRPLGRTGISLSPIGFGAFKIGRNEATKYAQAFQLPTDVDADRLLNGVLDLGINYIDTAPAYGLSEERIGRSIGHRRREFILSTKVGEEFAHGRSTYDFSARAVRLSVERSLRRLRSEVLDIAFIHANADDLRIVTDTDVVSALADLKRAGHIRFIGLSGKTVEAEQAALSWADALMVEFNASDASHTDVIRVAAEASVGVVVKKGLGSGTIDPEHAIQFALAPRGVTSIVVGSLDLEHLHANIAIAGQV